MNKLINERDKIRNIFDCVKRQAGSRVAQAAAAAYMAVVDNLKGQIKIPVVSVKHFCLSFLGLKDQSVQFGDKLRKKLS